MQLGKNIAKGQIKTNAGIHVDRAFLAHFETTPGATDVDGVIVATLGAAVQSITEGFKNPDVPRALCIDGSVATAAGNVIITGTNYADDVISETIALNGTTDVNGVKAFKEIAKIDLPAQVTTPVKQVETATAAGTVATAGNAAVTVTSALFAEAVAVAVPVALNDDAAAIALAIRTALAADPDISANFDVSGTAASVILTAKVAAANDATLNIAIADGTGEGASVGVTTAATSADTTAGVAPDTVTIGWIDVLGLPFMLSHNTFLKVYKDSTAESTAPTVVVDADELEKNTIDLNSALDGDKVDAYFIL
jgi:hypothetical protein